MDDEQMTLKQFMEIKHALGGTIKKKSFRNHFCTGKECPSWEKLVEAGFATKRDMGALGGISYFVTPKAIEYLNDRGLR